MEGKATAYVFTSSDGKKWETCAPEGIYSPNFFFFFKLNF